MRVLHVDGGTVWGGQQNQVRLLMRGLARLGVEQLCICRSKNPMASRLRDEGLPVRAVIWNSGNDPRAFAAIAATVRHYDLVHVHDAPSFQLAIVPTLLARKPFIASRRVRTPLHSLKWNLATRVIAISQSVRDSLLESGVHERRIRIAYSGIDVDEVLGLEPGTPSLRKRTGTGPDTFLAGNVARLVDFKHQTLIPAAAAHADGISWVIIGEGPRRHAIEQAIAENGVSNRVRLSGQLPDARRFMPQLDLFVFTSIGEALGTSILDAMACGVPVIAPDDSGPGEVLSSVHEATGASLYPPGDAVALARAVLRVRAEPGLRAAMIAHQDVRLRDFVIEKTVEANLAVYHEVLRK